MHHGQTRRRPAVEIQRHQGDHVGARKARVRDTAGRVTTLRVLDIGSRTFGDDLRYVFGKNVAKARRDNKRIMCAHDVVPGR